MNPLSVAVLCVALLGVSAIFSMLVGRNERGAIIIGTVGCVISCVFGLWSSVSTLLNGFAGSMRFGWTLPIGAFHVGMDALSAYFLFCLFLISGITSVYAAGYLQFHHRAESSGSSVAFCNLLIAAMAMLVLARDGVLFIMAWEVMSIASFLLVTLEHEREDVRHAGYIYLVASQVGAVFLFVLFALLARKTGNFDFDAWATSRSVAAPITTVCFLLAIIGFGAKAGFWPLHIWLPYAHPAAPSPVSALMSGVMIKMGIYGILRTLQFLGPPPAWWGQLLIAIGIVSGVVGVLLALAQHDLKRLLAYHSVENIGIIAIGLGVGVIGQSQGMPAVAFFGFAGALLHVLNHALFKTLLFQAAGNVILATGQRNVDALGGLSRRMPVTSAVFLVGSLAICGLPPLNGFVSEWLIYLGAFRGAGLLPTHLAIASIAALASLALIGGLALACFVKAFGVIFLGEPRTSAANDAHELGPLMTGPVLILAGLCAAIGLFPMVALRLAEPAVRSLSGGVTIPSGTTTMLASLTRVAAVVIGIALALAFLRRWLLSRRPVATGATWGCGYALPTSRMQYTSASFAGPLLTAFSPLLGAVEERKGTTEYFPTTMMYEEKYRDTAADRVLFPLAAVVVRVASRLRVLQQGRVQLYLLYLFATLIVTLIWQLALRDG